MSQLITQKYYFDIIYSRFWFCLFYSNVKPLALTAPIALNASIEQWQLMSTLRLITIISVYERRNNSITKCVFNLGWSIYFIVFSSQNTKCSRFYCVYANGHDLEITIKIQENISICSHWAAFQFPKSFPCSLLLIDFLLEICADFLFCESLNLFVSERGFWCKWCT